MAVPTAELERLSTGAPTGYNNDPFNVSTNPYGFADGGYITNFFAALTDLTVVTTWAADEIAPIAGLTDEIADLGAIVADLQALAGVIPSISALAALSTQITALGAITSAISTVATNAAAVSAVATDIAKVAAVNAALSNINSVASALTNIATVVGMASDIATVAARATDVALIADLEDGTIAAGAISGVAAKLTEIENVADNIDDVEAVAGALADVNSVAGIAADVSALGPIAGDVSTVADISSDVTTVADNIAAVIAAPAAAEAARKSVRHVLFDSGTADADPGDGHFRTSFDLNAATVGTSGTIYYDLLDADGGDVTDWINSWDDVVNATGRGNLTLVGEADPSISRTLRVTSSISSGAGYRKASVTLLQKSGAVADEDEFTATYQPYGNDGGGGGGGITIVGPVVAGEIIQASDNSGDFVEGSGKAIADLFDKSADDLDDVDEGATNKHFTGTEKTKLAGIADSADETTAATVGAAIAGASTKGPPVDADGFWITDSADSNAPKRTLWSAIKATLKTYFDTLYAAVSHTHTWASLTSIPTTIGGAGLADATAFVSTRAAMKALDVTKYTAAVLIEAGREGTFRWDSANLSTKIAPSTVTSTSVNSTTEVITKAAHGMRTGQVVTPSTTVNGVTADTLYYVIVLSSSTFSLASSRANALAGTAFNLTGTTNITLKLIVDDLEGIYVIPTGKARDGSQGAWVRAGIRDEVEDAWWGVAADGSTDDTEAFQAALLFLKSVGGGVLNCRIGTHVVSMDKSAHDYACITVPANITIRGRGKMLTTFTRPSGERGTDGVLFVNENYDLNTSFDAAGNQVYEHLGMTDGATSPNRTYGDLIAFGNAVGLEVRDCYFGNHDQHAVDICRSKRAKVHNNTFNSQVAVDTSANVQVDGTLIWGIAGSPIGSSDVEIYSNDILDGRALNLIHLHTQVTFSDISIHDNWIDGSNIPDGGNAIGCDNVTSLRNVSVRNNTIILDGLKTRGGNFPSADDTSGLTVDGLDFSDNRVIGKYRTGFYAGDDAPSTSGALRSVTCRGNYFENDISGGDTGINVRVLAVGGYKNARISGNTFRLTTGTQSQTGYIKVIDNVSNDDVIIEGNDMKKDAAIPGSTDFYGIWTSVAAQYTANVASKQIIRDNDLDLYGADYTIYFDNPGTMVDYVKLIGGKISGNTLLPMSGTGAPTAHIHEIAALSDGSNNLAYVDLSSMASVLADDPYVMTIAAATFYQNIPLTGKRTSLDSNVRGGKVTIEIAYAPNSAAGLANDREEMCTVWQSSSVQYGLHICDVNPANGTFSIVTGTSGVSEIFNNATFLLAARTAGWIKIQTGV